MIPRGGGLLGFKLSVGVMDCISIAQSMLRVYFEKFFQQDENQILFDNLALIGSLEYLVINLLDGTNIRLSMCAIPGKPKQGIIKFIVS